MIRGVIDLHAHVLPELDDGPANMEMSVEMARVAVAAGTRVIAATSHINRGFGLRASDLAAARDALNARLAADGIPLDVIRGGEIALSRVPDLEEEELRALALGESRWLLLECPLNPAAGSMEPMVAQLRSAGFGILLGHPERSPRLIASAGALERLLEHGALAQVTSASFAGHFGEPVKQAAFAMLERGHVHVLGSDAHHPTHRPPDLGAALEPLRRRYEDGDAQFEWMAVDAPRALLAGEPLPARPDLPRAKGGGLLRRLRGA
jgi:protein-tyrosine phosphatase